VAALRAALVADSHLHLAFVNGLLALLTERQRAALLSGALPHVPDFFRLAVMAQGDLARDRVYGRRALR